MKSVPFILDRRLYDLLQEEGRTQFTTRELRDAYAKHLKGTDFRLGDVRRYVYEQIRRLLRAGWLVPDEERRKRGQVYHLQPIPPHLQLELIDNGFENCFKQPDKEKLTASKPKQAATPPPSSLDAQTYLEGLFKEIKLDLLSSMGETERYKQLLDEMPHLRDQVGYEYQGAKDRSSRLLGHLRAVENTLKAVASER
ncbi:hypothetical protein MHM84_20150 [Halomonas sp. McH1-25]|uniref:hypothetical protein n=1 Tax=unclassified Halomonas TaxID=2609666 RepID=UPI001EF6E330|nr:MULTISPECIES: hypothetical protein [unclassified Halomonas]MCG7602058.1 hypothetical protein [Halomonas sp. McH1-25]MCP1342894.1 hypothetical protein [Halomonas sp. FL8]MCP1361667.1 hypothetical protein [Halomonas sp. BBD45]MCP1363636.1 hypothetical protein [Halomonas sp. BBD48]